MQIHILMLSLFKKFLSRKENTLVGWYFNLVKVNMNMTHSIVMPNKERENKGIILRKQLKVQMIPPWFFFWITAFYRIGVWWNFRVSSLFLTNTLFILTIDCTKLTLRNTLKSESINQSSIRSLKQLSE